MNARSPGRSPIRSAITRGRSLSLVPLARVSLFIAISSTLLLTPPAAWSQQTAANDIWAPWVTKTTEHSATINWRGETDGSGLVDFATSSYYEKNKSFEKTVSSQAPGTYQHVPLTDLVPGTPYVYRVRPSGSTPAFAIRAFRSMPMNGPFTFVVISDSQEGHTYTEAMRFKYVAEAIAKEPDVLFVLHGGDYAGHESQSLWGKFFQVADPMLAKVAIFPTIGNHEYHNSGGTFPPSTPDEFVWSFDGPLHYSFGLAGVQFLVLDTPDPATCTTSDDPQTSLALAQSQVPWLIDQLKGARLGTFTIHHHPIWDWGRTDSNPDLQPWETLYQGSGISATFSGHTHNYQRYSVEGTPYFVVGNAGGRFSDLADGDPHPTSYVVGETRKLGYLKVTVDPQANLATAQEVFAASVLENDSAETPSVYDPPVIGDTVSFPLSRAPRPPDDPNQLLLAGGKVGVGLTWKDQYTGKAGKATAVSKGNVYGYFFFSDAQNPEVFVKVLDIESSQPYLLLWGGLTDFEYTVTFTNISSGKTFSATKPAGSAAGGASSSDLPRIRAVSWDPGTGKATEVTPGNSLGIEAKAEKLLAPRDGVRAAGPSREGVTGSPEPAAASELLLARGQVSVSVTWWSPHSGQSGIATALPQGDQFGFFYSFDAASPEFFVKVLDWGKAQPFLLFAAGLTDFEYTVTYRNARTGQKVVFTKPSGSYGGCVDGTSMVH